jgi:hypothetical protein
MIPHQAARSGRVKPGSGDPPGVGSPGRSWDHDPNGEPFKPVPTPHSQTDMAPSDTSETTPAADPAPDRAAAEAVREVPAADRPDSPAPAQRGPDVGHDGDNGGVELARIAWLVTVLACVVTIAILMVEGYYGYALVTLAVAVSAGINLT